MISIEYVDTELLLKGREDMMEAVAEALQFIKETEVELRKRDIKLPDPKRQ
jgi:hypothetical protein